MAVEIERKFMIHQDLWYALLKPEGNSIVQAYLVNEPEKVIRIRVDDSQGFITIKGPVQNLTRLEFEYPIPLKEALEIIGHFSKKRIEKMRYKIEFKGHIWEIDEFFGENEGLILAEIELKKEEETFEKPSWIGEEVTSDFRYYNSYLFDHPFTSW
jgi:adenylate cyclase